MIEIDEILKRNMRPDYIPADDLNAKILESAKDEKFMKNRKIKSSVAVASLVGTLFLGSMSAYAAFRILSPAQVASELETGSKLEKVFSSDNAIKVEQTQQTGGYNITLMGMVTGKDLVPFIEDEKDVAISKNKTYAIVAIEREDGKPMPGIMDADYNTFYISPFIKGKSYMDMDIIQLNGNLIAFEKDGVQYELLECDDLEIFSQIGVYLGITKNIGEGAGAFVYDEKTGIYSRNQEYDGVNALFELPLDKGKADNEAAEKSFEKLKNDSEESSKDDNEDKDAYDYYIDEYGLPVFKSLGVSRDEEYKDLSDEEKYIVYLCSPMLTAQQREKIMSYGTVVEDEKYEEQDGIFHIVTYNGVVSEWGSETFEEGEYELSMFGRSGSGAIHCKCYLKKDGVLAIKTIEYDKNQIEEMYNALHETE